MSANREQNQQIEEARKQMANFELRVIQRLRQIEQNQEQMYAAAFWFPFIHPIVTVGMLWEHFWGALKGTGLRLWSFVKPKKKEEAKKPPEPMSNTEGAK